MDEQQMIKRAKKKMGLMPKLKDIDGKFYYPEQMYRYFVLMSSDFGYKKCFSYFEILTRLT